MKWTNNILLELIDDSHMKSMVKKLPRIYKLGSQKGKILKRLVDEADVFQGKVRSLDLNKIGFRYPSRIKEMRDDGWDIETERVSHQEHYYKLSDDQARALIYLFNNSEFNTSMFNFSFKQVVGVYGGNK